MVSYSVGPDDGHRVDHPPLFACREHKQLLRLSARFVEELLSIGQDVMPGNPEEVAQSFHPPAAVAYRLPEWLIPPKVILFNPQNLRGPEALPFCLVLVDEKRFFAIPARYLTPDRFDGCEECKSRPYRRPQTQMRRRPPPSPAQGVPAMRRPPPGAAGPGPSRAGGPPSPSASGRFPPRPPGAPAGPGPRPQ